LDDRQKKKEPHIRIPAGFMDAGWGILHGRIQVDCKGIDGPWVRCKTAVFWQTEQYYAVFSTRTEKEDNRGFAGSV